MPPPNQDICDERHGDLSRRVGKVEKEISNVYSIISDLRDRLANRLPTWATLLIALLMGVVGALLRGL